MSKNLKEIIKSKLVIGMIHVNALPGTPKYSGNVKSIINKALVEAEIFYDAGIDALMIENMHDIPYLKREVGPEVTSVMSIIAHEIKVKTGLPIGIQILAGANKEALAAAHAAGIDFIRAEGFVFAHVADEGIIESDAGELLRYRKQIRAEDVLIFTDIKKKHSSHSITSDISIVETAKAAEFFLSDGVIVTGRSTGEEADLNEIKNVRAAIELLVIIGSGITINNIEKYFNDADAFIIGSYFKKEGNWQKSVEPERVEKFMKKVNKLKEINYSS